MHAENRRCPRVWRRSDGTAYDANARVTKAADGTYWTTAESRRDVGFPYLPVTEVVEGEAGGEPAARPG